MAVNCAALPEQLLESELFGHEKGAFTGAVSTKKGLMEIADGGSFFLDEVADMPPVIQVKLLRVLQEREFMRVGGVKDITVDIRIIAASDQNLEQAVQENRLRESLYYRLNVVPIKLPPLRERIGDVPLLIEHFLKKYREEEGGIQMSITPEAIKSLDDYPWPGNVRELENVIQQLMAISREEVISLQDLPEYIRTGSLRTEQLKKRPGLDEGVDLESILDDIEKSYLMEAMEKSAGIKKKAAELLNLSFRSLRYRLKKHQLSDR